MISDLAVIENGAKIGKNVCIEPFAYIGSNVEIGDNCIIKSGARILGNTKIGNNCKIFSYAILGDIPQDISYKEDDFSALIIGENTTIREFCTINCGTQKGDGYTRVGKNNFIMAYVHIAHDCTLADNIILANNVTLAGHVEVGSFSVIGGLTPVHQWVKIGDYCMLGGASALSQDLPHFCLAEGNRAYVRSLNLVGLRRHLDKDKINEISDAFSKIFRSKTGLISDRAKALYESSTCPEVLKMCSFILNTKRGIPTKGDRSE
ncbi:acyl-ACP--UDP-N-acetylglucosamine O-acyltransferase [Campylobacter sp. Cr9]|uniref:acyl-ACP--UDP-N-acetylglucosamine O-acyltransferase n=1 Tax=unclassified Campylobacter TaxID=2593542 RepID=UPI001EFBCB16|nr:acyl-ACP--UDP-N-acetylglucosamine O-acyltransferase [Campylobacter sp. RM5004]MBZ7984917.1 acyl-ACP--UDP-N-acetylglucosamine O-acyltransferase [Campylobacter sp. Cr9]ULO02213.1 UDP-N-acetylglucosamine acyltransferase [Campylobacter sp. RM5004]